MPRLSYLVAALFLASCGPSGPSEEIAAVKEAWDVRNDPRIFGIRSYRFSELVSPAATRGNLDRKPWSDNYWPYTKKGLARRYQDDRTFGSFQAQVTDALTTSERWRLSPAEKFDLLTGSKNFALTRYDWAMHDWYEGRYPGDTEKWAWAGSCAGWSSAAVKERAPVSHVLAVGNGTPLLFWAGDLRALLTKAYDLAATDGGRRMIGQRCDFDSLDTVVRDRDGRVVDGVIVGEGTRFYIMKDDSWRTGAVKVTSDPRHLQPFYLLAEQPLPRLRGETRMHLYTSGEDLASDLEAGERGRGASRSVNVRWFQSCRDLNPAALHAALVGRLSDLAEEKQGFTVELAWGDQVWNHPIYGYSTTISGLRPVSTDPPKTRLFRAPGTAYVADVRTTISVARGVEPAVQYDGEMLVPNGHGSVIIPGTYQRIETLRYSLEFDARGWLIGGEWDVALDRSSLRPDFIWYNVGTLTDHDASGRLSPLPISKLRPLIDCSTRQPDAMYELPGGSRRVPVVTCPVAYPESQPIEPMGMPLAAE